MWLLVVAQHRAGHALGTPHTPARAAEWRGCSRRVLPHRIPTPQDHRIPLASQAARRFSAGPRSLAVAAEAAAAAAAAPPAEAGTHTAAARRMAPASCGRTAPAGRHTGRRGGPSVVPRRTPEAGNRTVQAAPAGRRRRRKEAAPRTGPVGACPTREGRRGTRPAAACRPNKGGTTAALSAKAQRKRARDVPARRKQVQVQQAAAAWGVHTFRRKPLL